jgi:hypothetical protein
MARRVLTSISVMGTPNSHIGMPRNNGAYLSSEVPVNSESIVLSSGITLPFTGYFSPQPVSYFEDTFYRIFNSDSGIDSSLDIDGYVEWTASVTPTGQDLEDDDSVTGAVWSSTYLQGDQGDVIKEGLDGGIAIFDIKDRILQLQSATMTRLRLDITTGSTITGSVQITCEFWASANSVASVSNPYNNGSAINIRKNARRKDVKIDRKI